MKNEAIDIWAIRLDSVDHSMDESLALLSESEQSQAGRYIFPEIQRRYIQSHAGLRRILAHYYLAQTPEGIQFVTNAFGKPALAESSTQDNIQFSLSHSGELALVAVTVNRPLGVDVEWIKPLSDHLRIAKHHFSTDEVDALNKVDPSTSGEAFIQLWAGKEALIKARGEGLNIPLDQFSLANLITHPGHPSCKVTLPGDTRTWFIDRLTVKTGYLGAVAVAGGIGNIRYLEE